MFKHILCHIFTFLVLSNLCVGQQVTNVYQAFEAINSEPEIIEISNNLDVPSKGGHLQGVQVVVMDEVEKLLVSGSSLSTSYILEIDLLTRTAEKVIHLMDDPYRHAGGIQVSGDYLVVGIEDNHSKTFSKVCFYNHQRLRPVEATPKVLIERRGKAKEKTAGATGLLETDASFLAVVSNWDSRHWDFYGVSTIDNNSKLLTSFEAPDDWPSYQAINLISDSNAIYAIAFYELAGTGQADLVLVSKHGDFEPIMRKVATKSFNCKRGADFGAAAGLQIDGKGKLHIWATQRNPTAQIVINKFSVE